MVLKGSVVYYRSCMMYRQTVRISGLLLVTLGNLDNLLSLLQNRVILTYVYYTCSTGF